jgi:5-formyltetrahydrofolate cyclo-ligase
MPKGEIQTDEMCQQVLKDGKKLYVPRVGLDFEQCDMDMVMVPIASRDKHDDIFHKDWPRNKWGIPEAPRSEDFVVAKPGSIDLLVVPGLGFDRKGSRLGQGKGYYDRFITKMSNDDDQCKKPFLIAVGMVPSLVEGDIPTNNHDRQMDMIILPQLGVLQVEK